MWIKPISVINKLIEEYNTEKKEQQRLEKLNALYLEQKKLMHTTPPKAIALFPAYIEQMLDQFFKALKDQFTSLGIDSLSETTKPDPTLIGSLPEIIANMPPEKIDRLLSILSQGELWKINQLQQLYEPYEIEYDEYQEFLKSHTISFLGGGNSKNFKVTNTLTGKIFILKVDERLGTIKTAEMYLRERSLKNVLTKVYAERSGKILNAEKKNVVKTLIVTDFCQGSDLESLAEQTLSDEKRLELALIIYSQMATILTNIVNDGNAFPDMKNANWLIENDSLFIADCKSFVFINNQHEINFNLPQNRFLGYISTKFLNPPEKWPLIADSLHAYMFGKNLYQFLTNCTQDYLKSVVDQTQFCFAYPIFSTPRGKIFADLIRKLVRRNPAERISLNSALQDLQKIQEISQVEQLKKHCQEKLDDITLYQESWKGTAFQDRIKAQKEALNNAQTINNIQEISEDLDQLKQEVITSIGVKKIKDTCLISLQKINQEYRFGNNDSQMMRFMSEKQQQINAITDLDTIQQLSDELANTLKQLSTAPGIKTIGNIIERFRCRSRFYTLGMRSKALHIEQALADTPVQERMNITKNVNVLKALAAHRHPFRANPVLPNGEIDDKKAATSYRFFKTQVDNQPSPVSINLSLDKKLP